MRLRRLTIVLTLLSCVGCGLPASGHVRVDPSDVPFGLLSSAPPGVSPSTGGGPRTQVYFVRQGRLVAVERQVIGDNVPAEAVRALLTGPTPAEAARGLTSDIPAGTRLVSLDLDRSVASVDLSPQFGNVGGSDQVLATAELVYTLTASPYIDAVALVINGKRVGAPDASGSLVQRPHRRSDYRALLAGG